jgi:biopolymer transport protein ExbB/TolQ
VGGPLVGLLFTVLAMIGAFHTLGQQGISDPQVLSTHIGGALVATVAGLVVGATVGVPLIVVAVILHFTTKSAPSPNR